MPQSSEELEAQYGPGSAVDAALHWIVYVLRDGDLERAWPMTDEPYRRDLAQDWLETNRHHPDVASEGVAKLVDDLAEDRPTHPLWRPFADSVVRGVRERLTHVDLDKWGWASRPRPISPGFAYAILAEAEGEVRVLDENEPTPSVNFLMHHIDDVGWRMAGTADVVGL